MAIRLRQSISGGCPPLVKIVQVKKERMRVDGFDCVVTKALVRANENGRVIKAWVRPSKHLVADGGWPEIERAIKRQSWIKWLAFWRK